MYVVVGMKLIFGEWWMQGEISFFNLNIDIMSCFVCLLIVLEIDLRVFECLKIL